MRRVGNEFALDFGHLFQPGFDIGKPSALSKGPPTKTTTSISQLFPTKPLIAGRNLPKPKLFVRSRFSIDELFEALVSACVRAMPVEADL
jgi:hypothetical protein